MSKIWYNQQLKCVNFKWLNQALNTNFLFLVDKNKTVLLKFI